MLKFDDPKHHENFTENAAFQTDYSTTRLFHHVRHSLGKERTFLQIVFEGYLAIASNVPFLIVFCMGFSKTLKKIDDKVKNVVLFILMLIVFIPITVFVLIDTDSCEFFLFFLLFFSLLKLIYFFQFS